MNLHIFQVHSVVAFTLYSIVCLASHGTFEELIQQSEDLPDLRKQRGTKKASITQAKTYVQDLSNDLEHLNIINLQRHYENLLTVINHYETIAERVATLEGKSFDVEDDSDPQMTENCLVRNLFLNKISAYRIISKGKYIVQKLNHIGHMSLVAKIYQIV